jgi:hypothetical protein
MKERWAEIVKDRKSKRKENKTYRREKKET